jgi:hypothetical protein
MSALDHVHIDPHSTIAGEALANLQQLVAESALTLEALALVSVIALARLEACIFGALEDPTVGPHES